MRGVPCLRGLRIPVATVLGRLAAGQTEAEILADFPDLELQDIKAALEYAGPRCRNTQGASRAR